MSVDEYDKDIEWIVKYNGTTTHKFKPDGRLVRCKGCKNHEHIVTAVDNEGHVTKECNFCNHWKRIIDVNDFCSYGERKEQM